jgi:hypothetical protein
MPPAVAAAGILGATSLIGGAIASGGASDAAQAQAQANAQGIAEQRRQFDLTRSDFAPYLNAGKTALPQIQDLLGLNGNAKAAAAIEALKASPAYQSLYNNGQEAILQNAAATGGLRGGNTQGALANFGRDTLSSVISDQLARLGGLAGMGQNATGSVADLGQNTANSISGLLQASGNAAASGALSQAGIWSSVLNNLGSIGQGLFPSGTPSGASIYRGF